MKQLKFDMSEKRVCPYWYLFFKDPKAWDEKDRQIIRGLPLEEYSIPFADPDRGIDHILYELKDEFPDLIKLSHIQL